MSVYVSVSRGEFSVCGPEEETYEGKRFAPTRAGLKAMAIRLAELNAPEYVTCSSSVDFSQEAGMPEGFDAGEFVGVAIDLARWEWIDQMDEDPIAKHVARVVLEH